MIYSQCETCKVLATIPGQSVVATSRASTFNEILTLDLSKNARKKTDPLYD